MNKRKVTIKDVAKMAGVSPSTVSRAIYDSAPLKQETKDRIFYAMAKLNYYPNAAARSLVQKKTMSLGVILPNDEGDLFLNPFFIHALRGLSVYAQSRHYFILYAFSRNQDQELEYIKELYRSRRVDGFVMLTVREKDQCIDYMQSQNIPFVVIGHPIPDDKMLWVDNDNFQAMYKLTNWMIDRGYRSFMFLGGPSDLIVTRDRMEGFIQAMRIRRIDYDQDLIICGNAFSQEEGYRITKSILESGKKPDAILASDDLLALGALNALQELNAPEIAVTGFNNTVQGQFNKPALTTVDIHPFELGHAAAKLLISYINEEDNLPNHFIIDTDIIPRETTRN